MVGGVREVQVGDAAHLLAERLHLPLFLLVIIKIFHGLRDLFSDLQNVLFRPFGDHYVEVLLVVVG